MHTHTHYNILILFSTCHYIFYVISYNPLNLSENGYWRHWSDWGECSLSCGNGTQLRERECVTPRHGGDPCEGPAEQEQLCNTFHCPGTGNYSILHAFALICNYN